MWADKSWAGAIAPVLMMMVILLPAGGAAGAETSGYAPENIDETYKQLSWLCMDPLPPAVLPVIGPTSRYAVTQSKPGLEVRRKGRRNDPRSRATL